MNKVRKIILKRLYELNKVKSSQLWYFNDIKTNIGVDLKTIERETDYLKQKGYIEKQLITTTNILAYACRITAQGTDFIESKRILKFPYIGIIKFIAITGIPLLAFYLDLFGLKSKAIPYFLKKPRVQDISTKTKEQSIIPQAKNKERELQNKRKIARVKISRIIEDANSWLEKITEENRTEMYKISSNFNNRNMTYSGMHVVAHIKRVNDYLEVINDYTNKEVDRKIEDLLLPLEEDSFENVNWLKDEYQRYIKFIEASKKVKNRIKQQNSEYCVRFCDKATFDRILKSNPYREEM